MATPSNSTPGKAVINHEAGDTLIRTITVKIHGIVVDLSGCTIKFIISEKEDGGAIILATIDNGVIATDLANGTFDIFIQTLNILESNKGYYYKVEITFADGEIQTILEDKLKTT
jgi:hypothetical protein